MNIRKFLLCTVAVGAMASVSLLNAQDEKKGRGGRGFGTPEQRIERLEQAVGSLSADQKEKIKAIYAKSAEKMQALPQEERREKGMELMREAGKEVRAVLNAEQQKKYDEMMAQMGQGRGQGRGDRKKNN